MLIYLDMCSLQRPFDDQSQLRVVVETNAVLAILALLESGTLALVASVALDFENGRNPYPDRKARIGELLDRADRYAELTPEVERLTRSFVQAGLKALDALHFACAVETQADYFYPCDDRLLKRARPIHNGPPKVLDPLELIVEIGS